MNNFWLLRGESIKEDELASLREELLSAIRRAPSHANFAAMRQILIDAARSKLKPSKVEAIQNLIDAYASFGDRLKISNAVRVIAGQKALHEPLASVYDDATQIGDERVKAYLNKDAHITTACPSLAK